MKKWSIILITGATLIILFLLSGFILVKKSDTPKPVRTDIHTTQYKKLRDVCVLEINDGAMWVMEGAVSKVGNEKRYFISRIGFKDDKIAIKNGELQVGDIVDITYTGGIQETYPATYAGATKIEIVGVASEKLWEILYPDFQQYRSS